MADEAPIPAENPEPPLEAAEPQATSDAVGEPTASDAVGEPTASAPTGDSAPAAATATEPPPEPSGAPRLWIAAPALITPALVGLLFLLGAPQALRRTLSGGDQLEPNDTFAQALPLAPGVTPNIRCGLGDVDWFTIRVPQGKCLQLTTTPGPTDLGGTSVHDARGAQLARSRLGRERCVYTPESPEAHTVWIRVWSQRSRTYSLKAEFTEPLGRFEPNDEPIRATPIELGHHARLRCNGSDWFRIEQPANRTLLAKVESPAGVGVRLLPTTGAVAPVTSALPQATSMERVAATRALYAHVFGSGPYSLTLEAGPAPTPKASGFTPPQEVLTGAYEPNDSREQAVALKPALYSSLRCNGKDWYSIDVPKDSTLTVRLEIDRNRGDLQLKLEAPLAQPGGRSSSRYGNYTKAGYELRHVTSDAESVRVLVSGSRMAYRLSVQIEPGLPGTALTAGEYPSLFCESTDLWRIMLNGGERLTVDVANSDGSWMELTLYDKNWVARGSSNSGGGMTTRTFSTREAGPVFVEVSGSQFTYSLDVAIDSDTPQTPFVPPISELCGPGVYPERVLAKEAYYAVDLSAPGEVAVDVGFRNDQGDIDLELLDSFGRKLSRSSTTDDVEHVEHVFGEAQRFYVRVYTYSEAEVDYELSVAVEGRTSPSEAEAPLLAPGLHRVTEPTRQARFRVNLEAGERLAAALRFAPEGGRSLELSVHDARGRELKRGTQGDGVGSLSYTASEAQTLIVRVSGQRAMAFELDLGVAKPE